MTELLQSLQEFLTAGWQVLVSLAAVLAPWTPLAAWIGFWLFAVNWIKLREVLVQGGWIGLVLVGVVTMAIWGLIAPPVDGYHELLGLRVGNFVGKFVFVGGLFSIMLLCGAVQLSGFCASCCQFEEDEPAEAQH